MSTSLFVVTFNNTAGVTTTQFNIYTNIMRESFAKWDTVITGLTGNPIPGYKINVTVNITPLGSGVLGGANVNSYYALGGAHT